MTLRRLALAAALLMPFPALALAPARPAPAPAPRPAAAPAAADLVTEANLSRDMLKAMYDAAKVPASIDGGGNLVVNLPQVKVFVLPAKDSVRLMASYAFSPRATLQEKLDLANRINDEYIMARASLPEQRAGTMAVDYYVILGPGISKAAMLAITRRFAQVVVEAIAALDTDRLIQ